MSRALAALLALAASGGDPEARDAALRVDAGDDAGVEPAKPAPPAMAPCPAGWTERDGTCDPWPAGAPDACGAGEVHWLGGPPPAPDPAVLPATEDEARTRGGKRSRYWRWAELLRRTFGLDPERCNRCGGPMKIVALVTEPESIARSVRHLGEPIDPPPLSPARVPPYYQSPVLRRRPSVQQQSETRPSAPRLLPTRPT